MSLEALAGLTAFAVNNNNVAAKKTPLYELPTASARKLVKIKDGNRTVAVDGSQALTLTLGRRTLSLEIIAKGASRVNAPKEQVATFTTILQQAIDSGSFDVEIKKAQEASRPVVVAPVAEAGQVISTPTGTLGLVKTVAPEIEVDIDGLDFSGIE